MNSSTRGKAQSRSRSQMCSSCSGPGRGLSKPHIVVKCTTCESSIGQEKDTRLVLLNGISAWTQTRDLRELVPTENHLNFPIFGNDYDPNIIRGAARLATDVPEKRKFRRFLRKAVLQRTGSARNPAEFIDYDQARLLAAAEEAVAKFRADRDNDHAKGRQVGRAEGFQEGYQAAMNDLQQ